MAEANSLHEHAVQAEKHLEQLATGMAQAGIEEGVIQTVSKMADVTRKIVTALGKGQEQTGDSEPPAPEQAQPAPRPTVASATEELHREQMARAQR